MPCAASGPSRERSLSPSRSRSALKPHLRITILLVVARNFHVNAERFSLTFVTSLSPLVGFYIARARRLCLLKQRIGERFHP